MLITSPNLLQGKGSLTERFPIRKLTPGFHPGYLFEIGSKLSFKEHVWTQGETLPGDHRAVAILGSRVCHPRAQQRAYDLAASLARRGVCIVSGLDVGICKAAHTGAAEAVGRTLMVLPNGLHKVRPCIHRRFYQEVIERGLGAGLSPFRPDSTKRPDGRKYIEKNKLITALSRVLIIAEAGEKSHSMSCVLAALTRGIPVGFLPHMMNYQWVQAILERNLFGHLFFVVHNPEDVLMKLAHHGIPATWEAPANEPKPTPLDSHGS